MKALVALFALCLLVGCQADDVVVYRHIVPETARETRQAWVAKCILDANPKSDEEPEDMIRQCEDTSERLFGIRTRGVRHYQTHINLNPIWLPWPEDGPHPFKT